MTLTEFLLARLAEDMGQHIPSGRCTCDRYMDGGEPVYHMPQCEVRLVRDVEVKRRIVALHKLVPAGLLASGEVGCETCDIEIYWSVGDIGYSTTGGCETLRLLAQPYADHPDYRDEWRP